MAPREFSLFEWQDVCSTGQDRPVLALRRRILSSWCWSNSIGRPTCRAEGRGCSRGMPPESPRTTGRMPVVQKAPCVSGRGTWLLTPRQARCLSYKRHPVCRVEGRGCSPPDRQDACRSKDALWIGPRDVVARSPTGKMPVVQKAPCVSGRRTWLLSPRQARCLSYKRRPVCRVEGRGCSRGMPPESPRTTGILPVGAGDVVAHPPTGKMPVVQETPCVSGRRTWLLTPRQAGCLSYKRHPVCRVEGRGCSLPDRQDACRTKGALPVGSRDVVAHPPTGRMPVVQKAPCVSGRGTWLLTRHPFGRSRSQAVKNS